MNDQIKLFAFVLMPFKSEFHDIYKLGIKETAEKLDIVAQRVDEQIYQEGILERIYRQIDVADIIIADMSNQNPNVFYEVGYAHAKNKICILLTSESEDIPFDLKHRRHIVYGSSIQTLRERLTEELLWAKGEIQNIVKSRIKVVLKGQSGSLTKTKLSATGETNFKVDLLNEADKPSTEIDAIYFYTKKDWVVYQNNSECASTDSDIPIFEKRHFITPPVRRLNKNSWAQINFSSKKTLARVWLGEEIKDSYRLTGRAILRLVTTNGNFDYELSIDVTIDDIPF